MSQLWSFSLIFNFSIKKEINETLELTFYESKDTWMFLYQKPNKLIIQTKSKHKETEFTFTCDLISKTSNNICLNMVRSLDNSYNFS